jgi:Flp pilus assembly protein TadD
MAAQGSAAAGGGIVRPHRRSTQAVVSTLLLLLMPAMFAQKSASHGSPAKEPTGIARAEDAIDKQNWSEAEVILRKLVASNAKDARAWFDLGFVMHAQQNYPGAILAYRGAVAAQPQSFECNLNLGMMLAHESNSEASKYLEAATRLKPTTEHPQDSLSHAWAALAQVQTRGAPKVALDSWSHAVSLAPSETQYRLAFGEALEKSGDVAGAEREFRKANELQPNSTDALAALSNLFMRAKRLDEAEEMLLRLVTAAPQDESAHLQYGRVLSAEKKDTEAAAELEKALTLREDDWASSAGTRLCAGAQQAVCGGGRELPYTAAAISR